MPSTTSRSSEPLGPVTATFWSVMVTSTPEGTVIGNLPMRDMSSLPYQT